MSDWSAVVGACVCLCVRESRGREPRQRAGTRDEGASFRGRHMLGTCASTRGLGSTRIPHSAFRATPEQFQSNSSAGSRSRAVFRAVLLLYWDPEQFQSKSRAVLEQFQSSFTALLRSRAILEQFQSIISSRAVPEQFQSIFQSSFGSRAVSEQFQSSFRAVLQLHQDPEQFHSESRAVLEHFWYQISSRAFKEQFQSNSSAGSRSRAVSEQFQSNFTSTKQR